jgi:PIN domain nuclease of toxin-antitoxin system
MPTEGLQRDLEGLGVRVVPFVDEDARLLVEVRRTARRQGLRLSLADCCCLATGIRLNLPVVAGDQAWEQLRIGVDVVPLR